MNRTIFLQVLECLFENMKGLPAAKKKKSRKYDDYVDLGAGYDENDPFIDNTDAVRCAVSLNRRVILVLIFYRFC